MAEKSDDATEQGCDLHQLMSDILSRARLDVFRGHGLDALGLLESAFELSTKHSVLHVYEPVLLEYIAFARAERGDPDLALHVFGMQTTPESDDRTPSSADLEVSCYDRLNESYVLATTDSYAAALAEAWMAVQEAVLTRNANGRIHALVHISRLYFVTGAYDLAAEMCDLALGVLKNGCSSFPVGQVLGTLGNAYFVLRRYDEAVMWYQQASDALGGAGGSHPRLVALCACNIGLSHQMVQQYHEATCMFEAAIATLVHEECLFDLAVVSVHYSCTLYEMQMYDESLKAAHQALGLFAVLRPQLTRLQLVEETHASRRAHTWLALSNLKLGKLVLAIGHLEYCSDRDQEDGEMLSDGGRINSTALLHWVPLTLKKLNSPVLIQHVVRLEGTDQQVLSFLALPRGFGKLTVHFFKLNFGDIDVRKRIETYLADFGIQGWNFKQFHFTSRPPALPGTDIRPAWTVRAAAALQENINRSPLLFVVGIMRLCFVLCVHAVQVVVAAATRRSQSSNFPPTVCVFPEQAYFSDPIHRIPPPPVDACSELMVCDIETDFYHTRVDKSAAFLKVKELNRVTPLTPPFFDGLKVCRELYDMFLGPFAETLKILGEYNEIIVITRDCMAYLPFNALLDPGGSYVIDKFKLMHTPSLMMTAHLLYSVEKRMKCGTVPSADGCPYNRGIWRKPILLGKSTFMRFPKLDVGQELDTLKTLFDSCGVRYDSFDTNEGPWADDLRDALTCGSLLHIATHSTVSTVFVAGENDADEQLTDQDVAALCTKGDLTTSVIILNTCLCGGDNYLWDSSNGLVREFLKGGDVPNVSCCMWCSRYELHVIGVVCIVRSLSALDDNIARNFTHHVYKLLLSSLKQSSLATFPQPDIGDAVHLSMLVMSSADRRSPQTWSHYLTTGLWCNNNGPYM